MDAAPVGIHFVENNKSKEKIWASHQKEDTTRFILLAITFNTYLKRVLYPGKNIVNGI